MNEVKRIPIKVGMKLKIIKGDDMKAPRWTTTAKQDLIDNPPKYAVWIAGYVPVGSIGTVYEADITVYNGILDKHVPTGRKMLSLKFDGLVEKAGYCFGLGEDVPKDKFEVVL